MGKTAMDCNVLWNNFWYFCRLRAADRIPKQELGQSEARLRSQQISDAEGGRTVPDARLRQREGFSGGSLEANISRSVPHQQHQRSPHLPPTAQPQHEAITLSAKMRSMTKNSIPS